MNLDSLGHVAFHLICALVLLYDSDFLVGSDISIPDFQKIDQNRITLRCILLAVALIFLGSHIGLKSSCLTGDKKPIRSSSVR